MVYSSGVMRLCPLSFGLTAVLLLSGCGFMQQQANKGEEQAKEDEKIPAMPAPLHLGAVHQVYPEQGFCLLRIIGPIPRPGVTLITHPADGSSDRIGNLCVSNSQGSHNGMIAADIRSGTVIKGDRVFLYRSIAPSEQDDGTGEEEEQPTADNTGETPAANTADDTLIELPADDAKPAAPTAPAAATNTPAAATGTESTSVVPEGTAPETPDAPSERLNDIPDTISGWDNM